MSRSRPRTTKLQIHGCAVLLLALVGGLAIAGCSSSTTDRGTAAGASPVARWTPVLRVRRVVDLSPPRGDGSIVAAAAGRLALLRLPGAAQPFAVGPGGYATAGGEEPYIALSPGRGVRGAGCSFGKDTLYVLRLVGTPGVTAVEMRGRARVFARLPAHGLENGIALDQTGRFGHRLLVTATAGTKTTVYAIDCHGSVAAITKDAPKVEGGIAVAPGSFGRFAGQLIAPDENSGRVYAIAPDGRSRLVAGSGLPRGGDVGVESAGFVPTRFPGAWRALVADRVTPGNPHPGDDAVLALDPPALRAAGVRPGDLLVATEGGARTDAITCRASCRVRHAADGPPVAHLEGHIVFIRTGTP